MSDNKSADVSPLVAAAEAFHSALERFSALADGLRKARFDSRHGLERAAQAVADVANLESELSERGKVLALALAATREAQQADASAVQARALELQQRMEVFRGILTRFDALSTDAVALNNTAAELATRRAGSDQTLRDSDLPALLSELGELQERMTAVAEAAGGLASDARDADFDDLHRKIDSLRQQLLAARDRLGVLKDAVVQAVPRTMMS